MNTIRVSIIQDNYSAQPEALDERLKGGELARQSEVYRLVALSPQLKLAQAAIGAGTDLLLFREDCNGAGHMLHRLDRPDLLECLAEEIPGG